MRASSFFAGLVACLFAGGVARADIFTMTWTGGYGPGDATLTAGTTAVTGEFLVTALTGTQDGDSISLVAANGFDDNDNFIFQPTTLTINGIAFQDLSTGTDFSIFADGTGSQNFEECSEAVQGPSCADGPSLKLTTFDITPGTPSTGTVPEPRSAILLGALVGMAAMVAQWRRKRLQTVN